MTFAHLNVSPINNAIISTYLLHLFSYYTPTDVTQY